MFEDKTMEIFSSRDMIRQQLISYASDYLEMNNIDLTHQSYLSYLINVLSVLTANLIYYNTATYREFFLIRAQQKESVLNLAAMLGYRPDLAVPAQAQILVSVPVNFQSSTTVVMRGRHDTQYTPYRFWADDIPFSLENEVQLQVIMDRGRLLSCNVLEINKELGGSKTLNWRLSADGAYIHFFITATQADDQKTTFTFPPMKPYEYYNTVIPFTGGLSAVGVTTIPVKEEFVEIWNNELGRYTKDVIHLDSGPTVTWDYRASLFLVNNGEFGYTYRANENGIKLFFGNGVIGTQPIEGDTCNVTISITKGYAGNVLAGAIIKPDPLYALVLYNNTITSLPVIVKCINTAPALGGKDYPTIDEIREQAIIQVSTNSRMVSEYDYINASTVMKDLPILHTIPILKRSDLKRNEVCLFTDLLFENEYVPTRNVVLKIPLGEENNIIRFGDLAVIDYNRFENPLDYNGSDFVSMFDIRIDPVQRACTYFYTLNNITVDPILISSYGQGTTVYEQQVEFGRYGSETIIFGKQVVFVTYRHPTDYLKDTVIITFYYDKLTRSTQYDDIRCYMDINETGNSEEMTYTDGANKYFNITKNLVDIPEGNMTVGFQIKYYNSELQDEYKIADFQAITVVKQSLNEFMYSKLLIYGSNTTEYKDDGIWGILYDVPVILKNYLDILILDSKQDTFISQIIHRIVTFDVTEYRMLTDFVNIKFSNTYGVITNLNHNAATKGVVNRIDPETIPNCPGDGYICAVTNDTNVWSGAPWFKTEGGFLALYSSWLPNYWSFLKLATNDYVKYDSIAP